ncbi:MAG: tRNA dihydrouridine synthase DusB [Anaerolineae bacterium]|nr:tRNA dihydrouridine synthase DusB [Anaerolineae bacterium]
MLIGSVRVDPPLALAPMAGQTNYALRTLCREWGDCGLVCTELISSAALQHKGTREKSLQRFDWRESESPFAVQLFGSDPAVMAEAARIVVDHGADIVDINMGCWVPKVAKKGGGAALLRDLHSATAVVQAVVHAVEVPVTVKVRSGWSSGQPTAVAFARAAEQLGVQAVAVHARFADQGFTGRADWDVIRQVKEAVQRIPVFGNGDVFTASDARRMLTETGCDGVMIGRGALGRPWIFQQIAHELRTGESLLPPSLNERARIALRQAALTLETTPLAPHVAIRELRGQLVNYVADWPDAQLRERVVRAESWADLEAALGPFL